MDIDQGYIEFLQLVNRNATNNNINVDKPRFIYLYNSTRDKYIEWVLEKRNEDQIRYLAPLLTKSKDLTLSGTFDMYQTFNLPSNFFDHSDINIYAKGPCGRTRLRSWEIKNEDLQEVYHDFNDEPSVDWEETFYNFTSNKVAVYRKGFNIDKVELDYYRSPKPVDIEGYIKPDGSSSVNSNPELQDKAVRRILIAMAKQFSSNNNDSGAYQLNKDTLFSII